MATEITINTTETMEIDEFCDYVDTHFDLTDREQCIAAAPALRKLANNKALFRRAALETLKAALDPKGIQVAAAYMILNDRLHPRFVVRANLWPALRPGSWQETRDLFSYDLKHDHTFTFLTANYFGPGYTTKIWTNDAADRRLFRIGEQAELQYQGEFHLAGNTLLYFERYRDVHVQMPPEADSVSLNLIVRDDNELLYPQHAFETDSGKVIAYPAGSPPQNRMVFACLLATSDDPELLDVLDWAVRKEESPVYRDSLLAARTSIATRIGA